MQDPWQWGWEAAAAIATVLAVVLAGVALWHESVRARRAQQAEWDRADRLRREDQTRADQKSRARAERIALALDHELYSYGSALTSAEFLLQDIRLSRDANGIMLTVLKDLKNEKLPLIRAFIGDMDDFPIEVSTQVAGVLGTLNGFRAAQSQVPIHESAEAAIALGVSLRTNAMVSAKLVRMARMALEPFVSPHREPKDFAHVIDLLRQAGELPPGRQLAPDHQ